jgi:hypothetical protein
MDRMRLPLILALVTLPSIVGATPLDTAYDLLYAVETGNGDGFLATLTVSLSQQLCGQLEELRRLVVGDESLAAAVRPRFGLTQWELENLSTADLLGRMLLSLDMHSAVDVVEEDVSMKGGEADVTLHWYDGGSVSFGMVWEESSWRISESDLFSMLFR